jgi:hypothetical protein
MAYSLQVGRREFQAVCGNIHMHTGHSDGTKSHDELARIAEAAGLDFLVVTDHNVFPSGMDGYYGRTLLLVGEEVHDPDRSLQSSHTLCFDIKEDVAELAPDPQRLIDRVTAQGGFAFLAHPFERDVADFLPEPNISWRDWEVEGYAGIELWNYMSEFKALLKSKVHAILFAYLPDLAVVGPYSETLRKWDELLRTRRVAALGGSDAHGTVYRLGPLSRAVQPYDYLFGCVNTHLLLAESLTGELARDRALVYEALRHGHGFVGYERPAAVAGFRCWARSGGQEATLGEALSLKGPVELWAEVPARADLRLVRDGRIVARASGRRLAWVGHQAGAYRVEAYRRYAGRQRGWIFGNPIYVQ